MSKIQINWDGKIESGLLLLKEHKLVPDAYVNIFRNLPESVALDKIKKALNNSSEKKVKHKSSSKADKSISNTPLNQDNNILKIKEQANRLPISDSELNEVAIEAKRNADLLYKQLQNTRAQLLALTETAEEPLENEPGIKKQRAELADEIVKLSKQVDDAYEQFNYAKKNGSLPISNSNDIVETVNPITLFQQITNLRKSVAKDKKLEQTDKIIERIEEKSSRLEKLLAQYEALSKS